MEEVLYGPNSMNNNQRTTEIYNLFSVVPQNVSDLRDVVAGNGTVSFDNYYQVNTPAQADGLQELATARIGQYRPGTNAIAGIYTQKDVDPVGKAEYGYGFEQNGIGTEGAYWRYRSNDDVELVVEREGVETVIPRSLWSSDTNEVEVTDENGKVTGRVWGFDELDGQGQSGIEYNLQRGHIHHINFSWYGAGPVTFYVVGVGRHGHQKSWPVATYEPDSDPPFGQPNKPVFARLDNEGTATADNMQVGGRQFSTLGEFEPTFRETEHLQTNITVGTTSYTPILSIKRKSGFEGIELDIQDIVMQTDNTLHVYPEVDPTFNTTASYQTPSGHDVDETAIEVANQPDVTPETGLKYGGTIFGSGKNSKSLTSSEGQKFPFPRETPVVFFAKSLTNSATVHSSTDINEKW